MATMKTWRDARNWILAEHPSAHAKTQRLEDGRWQIISGTRWIGMSAPRKFKKDAWIDAAVLLGWSPVA
jgi:hypothetical protein